MAKALSKTIADIYAPVIIHSLDTLAKDASTATMSKLQEYFEVSASANIGATIVVSPINTIKAGFVSELEDVVESIVQSSARPDDIQFSIEALVLGRLRPVAANVDASTFGNVAKALLGEHPGTGALLQPKAPMGDTVHEVRLGLDLDAFVAHLKEECHAKKEQVNAAVTAT
ncbi:hypothetical protein BGZ94_003646 [Podila epigama]|nr:hypothetical protein BGZ94_003646 [Podila epigama]